MAPIHSRMEKPPKSWRQNFTHSGVVGGGVSALGPSCASTSAARALLSPCGTAGRGTWDRGTRGDMRGNGDMWGWGRGDTWGHGDMWGCVGKWGCGDTWGHVGMGTWGHLGMRGDTWGCGEMGMWGHMGMCGDVWMSPHRGDRAWWGQGEMEMAWG